MQACYLVITPPAAKPDLRYKGDGGRAGLQRYLVITPPAPKPDLRYKGDGGRAGLQRYLVITPTAAKPDLRYKGDGGRAGLLPSYHPTHAYSLTYVTRETEVVQAHNVT